MFMGDPYQVAVAFTIALVTFVIVRYVLMNVLILFGRRKFSAMLLTSSMISWTLLWVGPSFFSARVTNHLDLASMALTPLFVPGLLANDMDRTSPLRVVAGVGLAAAFVVPTTWWIQSIVDGHAIGLPWMLMAASTFVIIFWKSIRQLYRHYRPVQDRRRAGLHRGVAVRQTSTTSRSGSRSRLPRSNCPWSPKSSSFPKSSSCPWSPKSSSFPRSSSFEPRSPPSCTRHRRRPSSSGNRCSTSTRSSDSTS